MTSSSSSPPASSTSSSSSPPPSSEAAERQIRAAFSNLSLVSSSSRFAAASLTASTSATAAASMSTTPSTSAPALSLDDTLAALSTSIPKSDPHRVLRLSTRLLARFLDQLAEERSQPITGATPVTAESLNTIAEVVSQALTKFVLFIHTERDDSLIAQQTQDLTNHITNMVCTLRATLVHARATQAACISGLIAQVLQRIKATVEQVAESIISGSGLDAKLTGIVWESCATIRQAPLTNAVAVGRALNSTLALIKDAHTELSSIHVATASSGRADGDDDDDDDDDDDFDDDDDDDDDDDAFSPSDFAIVLPCIQLLSMASVLTRRVYAFILKARGAQDSDLVHTEWMEQQLADARLVSQHCDSLGAAIYPPQDRRALYDSTTAVCVCLARMLQRFPQHPCFTDAFASTMDAAEKQHVRVRADVVPAALAERPHAPFRYAACDVTLDTIDLERAGVWAGNDDNTTASDSSSAPLVWCLTFQLRLVALHQQHLVPLSPTLSNGVPSSS